MPLREIPTNPENELPLIEGVFDEAGIELPALPTFDVEVDTSYRKQIATTKHPYGTTWVEEWQMSDGVRRQILHGEPKKPASDIAVVKNTAWGTQVRGFNEDIARILMSKGLLVEIIGPEINDSVSLTRSAHDTHKILDVTERQGHHLEKVSAQEGYSRGAMIAFGVIALASAEGREIIFSNLTDPCLEHKLDFMSAEDREKLLEFGGSEVATFGIQLGKLALQPIKAWHYRKSADFSVQGLGQFARTGRPLFTGETGLLAKHAAATNPNMLLNFFGRSVTNHMHNYERTFEGCDNVTITHGDGGHLQGMDKQILDDLALSFDSISRQLRAGVPYDELDYTGVHTQARQL